MSIDDKTLAETTETAVGDLECVRSGAPDARNGHTQKAVATSIEKRLFGGDLDVGGDKKEESDDEKREKEEELRTLAVDFDDHGCRFKAWREVCAESFEEEFHDKPVEGPSCCLQVCKHMERHGGNPKAWFAEWCREIGVSKVDKVYHETSVIIETLWLAGTYDMYNVGCSMALEVLTRRLMQIVEAHARGIDQVNWDAGKHYTGVRSHLDLVPSDLRSYARRMDREDLDADQLRRHRLPGFGNVPGDKAAQAAVDAGGLPAAGGDARGRGKGRGRGRPPAQGGGAAGGR